MGKALFIGAAVATIALVATLWAAFPTVHRLPGWFWRLHEAKLSGPARIAVWAALFGCLAGVASVVDATPRARDRRLGIGLLIIVGFAEQHLLAFSAGRSLDEMRDRMVLTGHAEFGRTAASDVGCMNVVTNYDELLELPDQRFARSKPPGQLLVYCLTAEVADRLMPLVYDPVAPSAPGIVNQKHYRLINFAALFFPLLATLVIVPLTYLGRCFLGAYRATLPAFIYILTPGIALIQLHLDQVLYPLLAVSSWALMAAATRHRGPSRWALWAASGLSIWIGLFVSFSLLPALFIGLCIVVSLPKEFGHDGIRNVLLGFTVALGAFALATFAALFLFGYDPLSAYHRAMSHHASWKAWDDSYRWPAARLNVLEFAYWLGPMMVALIGFQASYGLHRRLVSPTKLALGCLCVIAAMSLFGRTIAEVARLWLYVVPALALVAAAAVMRIRMGRPRIERLHMGPLSWRLMAIALLQSLWIVALKCFQDFR